MDKITKEEISQKVRRVVGEKLGKSADDIKAENRFGAWEEVGCIGDLGEDSLDRVEIVMGIEDDFELEIPDEDATQWKTVGDMIAYVAGKVGA